MAGEAISEAFPQKPPHQQSNPPVMKRKRSQPGTPDPEAEVIALSPKALLATNRFLCEICGKGFQRDQNLQLHRRGHNLPWKLRQRATGEPRKKVYVCPERTCVHHHPSRALGDLTGIKKHFCRKHGEKKWKCDKCSKRYAVQSDWKAHSKTCGTREYRCDCGTLFSRRDSFITHRAFCDALAEEAARISAASNISSLTSNGANVNYHFTGELVTPTMVHHLPSIFRPAAMANCDVVDQAAGPGLSLWLGQAPRTTENLSHSGSLSEMHQLGPMSAPTTTPFTSYSINGQQMNCQLSWTYGNKMASASSCELAASSSLRATGVDLPKEASYSAQPLLASVPSLYSAEHHHHRMPAASADTSATTLLQKAAQVGVTASGSTSFLRGLEMNYCINSPAPDGNKYDGPFDSNHRVRTSIEHIIDNFVMSNQYGAELYSAKHDMGQKDAEGGGETRDFLGVGVQTLCSSSSNGWI